MNKVIKRHQRSCKRQGAAAVEFAISISILITIVFASIEFVRLNMMEHAIDHASYLAARKGIIVGADTTAIEQHAQDHLTQFSITGATVSITPDPITDETEIVQVDISVPMSGNSWISPLYFNGTMTGRTRMLAERAAAEMAGAMAASSPGGPPPPPSPPYDD